MRVTTVGIQGGPGSFNEQAALENLPRLGITEYALRYFESAAAVLATLESRDIDMGQFALFNSHAGFYEESLAAVGSYLFRPHATYSLPIRHALMARAEATLPEITTVLTHREVIRQCAATLASRFPHLVLEPSGGDLVDPADIGAALANGRLPHTVATLSNSRIAAINGLRILAEDLQDDPTNRSSFVLVAPSVGVIGINRTG